jgi:integrase
MPPRRPDTVDTVNERLRLANIPVRILAREGSLSLQATLPPQKGEVLWKQRKISLRKFGIVNNVDGLREAELRAHQLAKELATNTFNWENYLKPEAERGNSVKEWVEKLKPECLATGEMNEDTWNRHWKRYYDRLPQDSELTAALLLSQALKVANEQPNSWTLKRVCARLHRLAEFAGIEVDLRKYQGNYGYATQEPMDLPDDETIALWHDRIPNPDWQCVYGLMAAFGLRDHEVFFCHFLEEEYTLQITEGKTGSRKSRALYPEWVDQWRLREIRLPDVTARPHRKYQDLGDRISKGFKRYKIPFTPYALRHAYAIRGSVRFRLPVAAMASNLGHSPVCHLKVYNRWISEAHHNQVYTEQVLESTARPSAPVVRNDH